MAELSQGYIYLLGRSGVIGTEIKSTEDISGVIAELRKHKHPPILQGFGISNKAQAQVALSNGVDGTFVGSALMRMIADKLDDEEALLRKIAEKAADITSGTRL